MRREALFGMSREESLEVLREAAHVELASTTTDGSPVLRTLDTALLGDDLVFHGSPVGEKVETMGRAVVVGAVERVAFLPSWFVDPERACPATTLYRSVQVHGEIEPIESLDEKARALEALMGKHQPEGRFVPIESTHTLYAKALRSLLVFRVSTHRLDGKAKLGQNRSAPERTRILEGLWQRGAPGDLRAIELVRRACPDTPLPAFLRAPLGATLNVDPGPSRAAACAELLGGTYWNDRFSKSEIADAHVGSSAWITAELDGRVVASARASSDGRKRAWIYDVVTAPEARGRGLGRAIMRALLDHPNVRRARLVELGTKDANGFYERLGFVPGSSMPPRPYASTHMVLERPRAIPSSAAEMASSAAETS